MSDMTIEAWSAMIMAGVALFGVIAERFHYDSVVNERIGRLETKVDLFWGALEAQLPGMLLKGNPIPEGSQVAILLKKFQDGTIDSGELTKLACLLEYEAKNPDHSPGEVLAIVLMSATVKAKVGMQNDKTYNCM